MGLLAVAGFDLFAGGTLLFDIALPVGRQLALLGPDRVAWLDDSSRDPE